MSGEGTRQGDRPTGGSRGGNAATLVVGAGDHDPACREFADVDGECYRFRVSTDAPGSVECADTDDCYEAAVSGGVALSEAGVAASDAIANLPTGARVGVDHLVVCVDGIPHATGSAGRRRMFRFLHAVTHRVRSENGSCHVHVDVPRDAALARVLEPLFDRVVRVGDEAPPDASSA